MSMHSLVLHILLSTYNSLVIQHKDLDTMYIHVPVLALLRQQHIAMANGIPTNVTLSTTMITIVKDEATVGKGTHTKSNS